MLFNTVLFTGNANPVLAQEIATHLGVELGKAKVGRFSDGEVDVEIHQNVRARDIFVVQSTCAPTNENLMELCIMVDALQARLGAPRHRRDPVLRLRPPGPPAALDARADQRQGRRQPARGRRRRAPADDGPARRPDPGLLQHPGRQHLRVAGAAVRPADQALRRPRGRLARRRRRRARPRAGQAARLRPGDHRQAPAEGQRLRSDARHRRHRRPQLRDHGRHDRHRRHAGEGGRGAEGARREERLRLLHARGVLGPGDRAHQRARSSTRSSSPTRSR